MVYGINQAVCLKCGRPFSCGDCIDNFCSTRCEEAFKNGTEVMDKCLECGKEVPADLSPNLFGEFRVTMCDECIARLDKMKKDSENTIDWKDRKEKLKMEIQAIMNDALAGYIDKYKYKNEKGQVFVRWGRVQRHINEAIDLYWPKEVPNDPEM
jgi:hypothetical protein